MSNLKDYSVTIVVISALFSIIALGPAAIGFTLFLVLIAGVILGIAA